MFTLLAIKKLYQIWSKAGHSQRLYQEKYAKGWGWLKSNAITLIKLYLATVSSLSWESEMRSIQFYFGIHWVRPISGNECKPQCLSEWHVWHISFGCLANRFIKRYLLLWNTFCSTGFDSSHQVNKKSAYWDDLLQTFGCLENGGEQHYL